MRSWLQLVFLVLGAYAFTTGVLIAHVAFTALRSGQRMPAALIVTTGLTSVGVMVAVNFEIQSEFRYVLAGLGGLWAIAVILDLPIGPMSGNRGGA